jgi:hypothetical protein
MDLVSSWRKIFEDEALVLSAQHGSDSHVLQDGLDLARRKRIGRIVAAAAVGLEAALAFLRRLGFGV